MLLLSLFACGPGTYEIDTWSSPLALEADEPGDASRGEDIYFGSHWEDDSPYALACISCHAVDSGDTLADDADALTRAAHTTWNAAYRETWKVSHAWDRDDSTVNGAYGGQVCVRAYFPTGSNMSAQEAADLEAWMRENRDSDASAETASELDYGFTSWDTQDAFFASISDGADGWLAGADLGDVVAGQVLAQRYCSSCHSGTGELLFYGTPGLDASQLTQRIRKVELHGTDAPNDRMPRLPEDRLSDADLMDLLAYLTQPEAQE